jgi:outer membrane protein OmpA-like peptidoglycan-associated protein
MSKVVPILFMTATLAISGCQTTRQDAYTGEEKTNATTKGAVLGCAGGAILGAMIKDRKAAAVGCVAGGVTGAAVGQSLDKQEAALRQELQDSGVQVERYDDRLVLVMRDQIAFETGKSSLNPEIYPALSSVAKVMAEYDDTQLVIKGHTDSTGSQAINEKLSIERATSVLVHLRSLGTESNRMSAYGFGPSIPKCSNDTKEGRACNRRVELELYPTQS